MWERFMTIRWFSSVHSSVLVLELRWPFCADGSGITPELREWFLKYILLFGFTRSVMSNRSVQPTVAVKRKFLQIRSVTKSLTRNSIIGQFGDISTNCISPPMHIYMNCLVHEIRLAVWPYLPTDTMSVHGNI